jgi:hypothetical protein
MPGVSLCFANNGIFLLNSAMLSIGLRGGSAMDEDSSLAEPSESSSFPIDHAANVGVNLGDTPDSEIETAAELPDSPKVRRYIQADIALKNVSLISWKFLSDYRSTVRIWSISERDENSRFDPTFQRRSMT